MKKILYSFLCFSFIFATNLYTLDPTSSSLEWIGQKLTGSHDGSLDFSRGEVTFNDKDLVYGEIIVSMITIRNKDITNEQYRGYLEEHLKSEDFFHVDSFPSAHLTIKENLGLLNGGRETLVLCNLTIKGITHEVKFPVKIDVFSSHATASGSLDVDRSLYDIKYKSKSFFPDIGDKLIYDNFTLNFNIRANRKW